MIHQQRTSSSSLSSLLLSDTSVSFSPSSKSNVAFIRQYDFEAVGLQTGTDKVRGPADLTKCLANPKHCRQPQLLEPKCRTGVNHFYHTMYNARLGPLFARDDVAPFQMLEIGFFNGHGYDAFRQFMPQAEAHSLEISCLSEGPRSEGKWPYGNFAAKNPNYQQLLDTNRLHCGDAADYETLTRVWADMRRDPSTPPLKLVIDDGAHISEHMAITIFFWFPRLAPGGLLVVEDIQPIDMADALEFRNHFLPQLQRDLHYCGDPKVPDQLCFPTLHRFLQSVHCEMHICVLERNDVPAQELSREESLPPPHVFNALPCMFGIQEQPDVVHELAVPVAAAVPVAVAVAVPVPAAAVVPDVVPDAVPVPAALDADAVAVPVAAENQVDSDIQNEATVNKKDNDDDNDDSDDGDDDNNNDDDDSNDGDDDDSNDAAKEETDTGNETEDQD